jgi:hypothetical protein
MTQGVYLGRRAVDFQAALALKTALRDLAHAVKGVAEVWSMIKAIRCEGR